MINQKSVLIALAAICAASVASSALDLGLKRPLTENCKQNLMKLFHEVPYHYDDSPSEELKALVREQVKVCKDYFTNEVEPVAAELSKDKGLVKLKRVVNLDHAGEYKYPIGKILVGRLQQYIREYSRDAVADRQEFDRFYKKKVVSRCLVVIASLEIAGSIYPLVRFGDPPVLELSRQAGEWIELERRCRAISDDWYSKDRAILNQVYEGVKNYYDEHPKHSIL